MNIFIYTLIIFFSFTTTQLSAQQCFTYSDDLTKENLTTPYKKNQNSRMMLRVGKINLTGDYKVEDLDASVTTSVSNIEQNGWELSLVGGVDTRKGFDFRPMVTFQWFKIAKDGDNMASNMMMLGEFEFVYNFNQYFASFTGFNTGVGITDFKDKSQDAGYGAQFSLFIGVSGEVYKQVGYFVKTLATKKTAYFTHDDVKLYMSSNVLSVKYGLSYKF